MWPDACDTMCDTCGSSESEQPRAVILPQPRFDGVAIRLGRFGSSSRST